MKRDIRNISLEELTEAFVQQGLPKYRARQVHDWLWKKSASSFEEMTNLPLAFREELQGRFSLPKAIPHLVQHSEDGTIKIGIKLHDDRLVEGVMIPAEGRSTACVSSQVGCTFQCAFCATGQLKRDRNLTAGEIFDQVVILNEETIKQEGQPLSNIVFMGMGEPLLNYENVMEAIQKITTEEGLHMAAKRITLSTVGIARGIRKLAEDKVRFNLAWSLHAPTNEKRAQIMDVNKSNPIEEVMDALKQFYSATRNKITFEYILFEGFNDSREDAQALIKLCRKVPSFVNIIEYNKVDGVVLDKASEESRNNFIRLLQDAGIQTKVRRSRGKDIDAACGQLANKIEKISEV